MTHAAWPRAHGFALLDGRLKTENRDFIVEERLPETPSGDGEHLWLDIEKDGQNTAWVARQIARWAGCKPRDVSYAGLKDRHAVTRQTFSVHLPGQDAPSHHLLHIDGVRVVSASRHHRKLKTGQLIGNQFTIRVRGVSADPVQIEQYWGTICRQGVPNYFGPQRFGHDGQNVDVGFDLLLGKQKRPRHQQSIYLSAVRSFLFNELLAARVADQTWNKVIVGDFVQFSEGKTGFYSETQDADVVTRCEQGKLSPCASLPGLNRESFAELDRRERAELNQYSDIINALETKKVMRQFRKLRLIPESPVLSFIENDPVFSFFLPAGAFATTLLSELIDMGSTSGVKDINE